MPQLPGESLADFEARLVEHANGVDNLHASLLSPERMAAFRRQHGLDGDHPAVPHQPALLATERRERRPHANFENNVTTLHASDMSADERRELERRLGISPSRRFWS